MQLNKQKIFILIAINFLIVIILFIIAEYKCYLVEYNRELQACKKINSEMHYNQCRPKPYYTRMTSFQEDYCKIKKTEFRHPVGLNYKKKPILIFGCSYAYGLFLPENEIFSYKLSNLSKRPVYNRAHPSWSVQQMLYQLQQKDFYSEVKPPEYIIYVFISNHFQRLHLVVFEASDPEIYLRYKEKNGKLKEVKSTFRIFENSYFIKFTQKIIVENNIMTEKNQNRNFDFMKLHFEEAKKIANTKYPGAKFVILKYMDEPNAWCLKTSRWNELKREGFIVLDTDKLTGEDLSNNKYKVWDEKHPNEKAWEIITPALIKKLNL